MAWLTRYFQHLLVMQKLYGGHKYSLLICLLLLLSHFSYPFIVVAAESTTSPWQITADRIENYKEPERIIAQGNVVLQRMDVSQEEQLNIRADWIHYDLELNVIEARGNILISSQEDEMKADAATFNLVRQTGRLTGASLYFKDNKLYLSAKSLEKTGDQTYQFEKGWISSCRRREGISTPWAMTSADGKVTLEGYGVLKHSTFRVKDIPILYTPYLIFPAKLTRQTGFLFPELSHSSRDGIGFLLPFFVNISPSADMTFYPGHHEKRGGIIGFEARYMLGYESKGTLMANFLHDRTTDTGETDFLEDGYLRDTHDRYWLRGKIDHDFGYGMVGKVDFDVVSDRDYLQEYREGMIGFRNSNEEFVKTFHRGLQEESIDFRESTMQLTKNWSTLFLGGEVRGVDDVTDAIETQTLPRILFNGRLASLVQPIQLAWNAEYVNYWLEDGLGTQRLDVHPKFITPLPLGRFFEGKASTGVRQTAYQVETYGDESWFHDSNPSRTVWDASANIATTLTRDFGFIDEFTPRVSHTIRPNIEYTYVTDEDHTGLPELDGNDIIAPNNSFTYELYNYFMLGTKDSDNVSQFIDLGRFKISQNYDLTEARRELIGSTDKRRPFSDILFDLTLSPYQGIYLRYETQLSVYGKGITSYDLVARYKDERGDSLAVDYRYIRGSVHQLNVNAQLALTGKFLVSGATTRSLATEEEVESSVGIMYKPHCWAVEMQYSRTTDDKRFLMVFTLEGIGKALELGKSSI